MMEIPGSRDRLARFLAALAPEIVAEACAKVEKKTITSRVSIQRRLASEHTRNDSAQNDSSKTEG
jgi:hypothetical protein